MPVAAAIIGSAIIGAGVSVYQGNQQEKKINSAANEAAAQNANAIKAQKDAMDKASSQAKAQVEAKKKAVAGSKTVFTSPLGITDQAVTAKKTLLGA